MAISILLALLQMKEQLKFTHNFSPHTANKCLRNNCITNFLKPFDRFFNFQFLGLFCSHLLHLKQMLWYICSWIIASTITNTHATAIVVATITITTVLLLLVLLLLLLPLLLLLYYYHMFTILSKNTNNEDNIKTKKILK